jgi:N-sulfoglucosamine sulfohydrolase
VTNHSGINNRFAAGMTNLLLFWVCLCGMEAAASEAPLNVLFITADDLNYDSVGAYGCPIPDITPHIDRLARDGMRFNRAHVNIAICQPSRQSIMTGRYPLRNGAEGFDPIDEDVPTLQESLRAAGYLNGILGKEIHLKPKHKFCWDYYITESQLASGAGIGRSPEKYYAFTQTFLRQAKEGNKPFFLMANIHDPHRPFAGSLQEKQSWGHDLPTVTRTLGGDEITVPGFLPDLPKVRKEVAEYYTSVYRCDQSVGAIMKALEESGFGDNTLVMFMSDNGMAVPFAKANCYLNSTKTPWIVYWPGVVAPGTVDSEHLVSGIDYMPTVLDALGLEPVEGMDGSSFLPILRGAQYAGQNQVFTEFHRTFGLRCYPMRTVHGKRYGYIVNFWAGRTPPMSMDATSGLTFAAMNKAGKTNPEIAARVQLFAHRVLEEFYDFEKDPHALNNLIDHPEYQSEIQKMRDALEEQMTKTQDPALSAFLDRNNAAALDAFMEQQQDRARKAKK